MLRAALWGGGAANAPDSETTGAGRIRGGRSQERGGRTGLDGRDPGSGLELMKRQRALRSGRTATRGCRCCCCCYTRLGRFKWAGRGKFPEGRRRRAGSFKRLAAAQSHKQHHGNTDKAQHWNSEQGCGVRDGPPTTPPPPCWRTARQAASGRMAGSFPACGGARPAGGWKGAGAASSALNSRDPQRARIPRFRGQALARGPASAGGWLGSAQCPPPHSP